MATTTRGAVSDAGGFSPSPRRGGAGRPRVLIVGGGFGGLYAARHLRNAPVDITLVDRRNYHLFQPLLYQVATAVLNTGDIATPIRRILRGQKNLTVVLGEAQKVDLDARKVTLADAELEYDYLVLATGSTHSYFGHDDWARHAPGLKTIEDAVEIRRRALLAFEAAERELNAERRCRLTTFVIVGGGPTGVEMAGAIADMGRSVRHDFRNVNPAEVRVVLVEAEDRVLPTFPPKLSQKCRASLIRHGVEVRTGTQLTKVDRQGAFLGDERILSPNVIWAAGVSASPLGKTLGVETDRAGRVVVKADLSVPGHPETFIIGDLASAESRGSRVPGVAQAAMQGGAHTAENILRELQGFRRMAFSYREKGMLATIGHGSAVADLPRVQFGGFLAWVAWLAVHIFFLVGFRNRLLVMVGWLWAYLVKDPGSRLITGNSEVRVEQPRKRPGTRSPRSREKAPSRASRDAGDSPVEPDGNESDGPAPSAASEPERTAASGNRRAQGRSGGKAAGAGLDGRAATKDGSLRGQNREAPQNAPDGRAAKKDVSPDRRDGGKQFNEGAKSPGLDHSGW